MTDSELIDRSIDGVVNVVSLRPRTRHQAMIKVANTYEVIGMALTYSPGFFTAQAQRSLSGVVIGGTIGAAPNDFISANSISSYQLSTNGSATGNAVRLYVPKNQILSSVGTSRTSSVNTVFDRPSQKCHLALLVGQIGMAAGTVVGTATCTWYVRYTGVQNFNMTLALDQMIDEGIHLQDAPEQDTEDVEFDVEADCNPLDMSMRTMVRRYQKLQFK